VREETTPTRLSALVFQAKVEALRVRRGLVELFDRPARHRRAEACEPFAVLLAVSRTPLWSDGRAGERALQRGKVQNLRRAAAALDRVVVPVGEVFSFWRQVGRASRGRGYVDGRMLQQGCLVPSVGGGLCQLSNALYDVALKAGCEIVERHGHSRVVPGSAAAFGRDATVAWNYVDFRFRAPAALLLRARLTRDELVIELLARPGEAPAVGETAPALGCASVGAANSCGTCDRVACFRHEGAPAADASRAAFLVDENWPEFQAFLQATRGEGDVLVTPLDGGRWRLARYRWATEGFARTAEAPLAALRRAWAIRRTATQGARRRRAELDGTARLAEAMARRVPADAERLCVAQSLLPHLWRAGWLGGRRFTVLMTRAPIVVLQARLDEAHRAFPERATLADFRAPAWMAAAEAAALAAAEAVATPHAEIAGLFPGRAVLLDWRTPPTPAPRGGIERRIVFPGPTVARKGAWEVREAARALDLDVVLLGAELEGSGFWEGVRVRRLRPDERATWLDGVAAVVQPAVVEDQPRRLLAALAAGVPVVATAACGLPTGAAVVVPAQDADALTAALARLLGDGAARAA
jgi:hypothetical protein